MAPSCSFVSLLACTRKSRESLVARPAPSATASPAWRESPRVAPVLPRAPVPAAPCSAASASRPASHAAHQQTRWISEAHAPVVQPMVMTGGQCQTPREHHKRRVLSPKEVLGPLLCCGTPSVGLSSLPGPRHTEGRSAYASHGRTSATCASRIRRRSALDEALPDAAHRTGEAGTWPLSHPVSPHARLSLVSAEGVPLSSAHVPRAVLRNHGGSRSCSYGAGGSTDLCASQVVRPPSDRYAWA